MAAIGAAASALLAQARPTGIDGLDAAVRASAGALVVLAAFRAPRGVVGLAGFGTSLATLLDPTWAALAPAGAATVIAFGSYRFVGLRRGLRAVAGALIATAVLRLGSGGAFHGDTAVLAGLVLFPLAVGAFHAAREHERRVAVVSALGLALVGGMAGAATGIAVLGVRHDVDGAVDAIQAGLTAARNADQGAAVKHFETAATLFADADREVNGWWARAGRAVPVLSQNVRAIEELASIGHSLASTAAGAAAAADPEDARLADGRIDLDTIRSLEGPLERTIDALRSGRERARNAGSPWLLGQVSDAREELIERVNRALPDAEEALAAARVTPALLGADGPRRYFVAFVTPAEGRPSGGLVGNYAELSVTDGAVDMTAFGRNSDLNRAGDPESRKLVGPPDYLARYGDFNIPRYWQDVTFSPDFPSVAQVMEGLYPQSGGREVDGAISVDPLALASLLELTGPVEIPQLDEPLTAENAPDLLLKDQYVRFTAIAERVDFLETAAAAVFDRLTTGKLPGPGRIAQVLGPMVRQGRLKIHSVHPEEQTFLENIGLSGAYPPVRGQFLGVATATASQSKVDSFLRREIAYDAVVDPGTGRTDAVVTVTLHNDAPSSGLPTYVIGGNYVPPGVNRSYLAVYSPLRLQVAEVDGAPLTMEEETELGRWVATGYVDVPPGESRTVRVRLRGTVAMRVGETGTRLRLDVARQAVVAPDDLDVNIRLTPGWEDSATGRNEIEHSGPLTENLTIETELIEEAKG